MKRIALVSFALAASAACGDNSKECGPNTTDVGGVCTASGGSICGDGTKLDPATGMCLPDPTLCGGGTVFVGGKCQDPTAGLSIDLEEGPEPNGFESNATPAGTIVLKPVGDPNGFVIHGCVKPVADIADLDNYLVTVSGPTLLDITADGVQGLAAGFVSFNNSDQALVNWERFGINFATDMSHRELYLPEAGSYGVILSDTRSLVAIAVDGSAATDPLPPAGNPDGTSCYYVTIKQETPMPTALSVPAGSSGTIGEQVLFFSTAAGVMPNGFIDITANIASSHARAALVLAQNNQLRLDSEGTSTADPSLFFGGVQATDTTLVVMDYVYNYAITPPNYTLTFNAASSAQALPTTGTAVNSTTNGTHFTFPNFSTVNEYYFDVAAADQIDGLKMTFSTTVQGAIIDADGFFAGQFGGIGTTTKTFTAYNGLERFRHPGRYYLMVFDPTDAVGTAFTLTSTLTTINPGAVAIDTPLAAQADNLFDSVPYTLDVANKPWNLFNATGTNTGNVVVTMLDPATAYGRLDPITLSNGLAAGEAPALFNDNACPASKPGCSFNFPAAGAAKGFITASIPQTSLLAKVNFTAPTGSPTFGLDFSTRAKSDLGNVAAQFVANGETLTVAAPVHRYYFTASPGAQITITIHPVGATAAAEDFVIDTLAPNEAATANDNSGVGADEVFAYTQDTHGYTAFDVSSAIPFVATQNYDVTIDIIEPFYTVHNGATAFADACNGGTDVAFSDTDEGISAPVSAPSGFQFYGAAAPQFVVGTNGWLSFNTAVADTYLSPVPLPDAVGDVNIAPFWTDLSNIVVCKKTVGTKVVVQWTGTTFGFAAFGIPEVPVQFQAILDGADNSVEFVYGPGQKTTGANPGGDPAIAGVQDPTGAQGTMSGDAQDDGPFAVPGLAKKLTHP